MVSIPILDLSSVYQVLYFGPCKATFEKLKSNHSDVSTGKALHLDLAHRLDGGIKIVDLDGFIRHGELFRIFRVTQ